MKLLRKLSIIAVLFIAFGCNANKIATKKIIGKWHIVDMRLPDMPEEQQSLLAQMVTVFEDSYMDFKSDGTFVTSMVGEENKGKWYIKNDGKTIVTTESNDTELEIVVLTKTEFVMLMNDNEMKIELVMKK